MKCSVAGGMNGLTFPLLWAQVVMVCLGTSSVLFKLKNFLISHTIYKTSPISYLSELLPS